MDRCMKSSALKNVILNSLSNIKYFNIGIKLNYLTVDKATGM